MAEQSAKLVWFRNLQKRARISGPESYEDEPNASQSTAKRHDDIQNTTSVQMVTVENEHSETTTEEPFLEWPALRLKELKGIGAHSGEVLGQILSPFWKSPL